MQEATPSPADAAKRADLMQRLGKIIAGGVAGHYHLRAEVHPAALSLASMFMQPDAACPSRTTCATSMILLHSMSRCVVLAAGLWFIC